MRFLAALAAALAGCPAAAGQSETPESARPGRIWHVRISGDLDCDKLAAEVVDELAAAQRAGAGMVLLEMDGDRARLDLAWEVGRAVMTSAVPVGVYLHDAADQRVGAGQFIVGVLARWCGLGPRTSVIYGPGDSLSALAPADLDAERLERELSEALGVRFRERGGPAELARILVDPRGQAWAVPGEEMGTLALAVGSAPAEHPRAEQVVYAAGPGASNVRLSASVVQSFGLARANVPSAMRLALDAGMPLGASRTRRELRSTLAQAAMRAAADLDDARLALARAEQALRVSRRRGEPRATPDDYRSAGRRSLEFLDPARAALDRIDSAFAEHPELARAGPGVYPDVPEPSELRSARNRLESLRTRAREYATR